MASLNTYVSFKRVRRFPNNAASVASGTAAVATGDREYSLGVDVDRPALLLGTHTQSGEELRLRIDLSKLVVSVLAAEAAEADRWEPLEPGDIDGYWGNTILSAHVQEHQGMIHISYHRRDRAPIRDWRVGQRLKDQLAGPEWEGVELYPAQSRMVDTSNEYHIFCTPTMPFGFDVEDRATQDQIDELSPGAVQRDDPEWEGEANTAAQSYPVRVPDSEARPDFGMAS